MGLFDKLKQSLTKTKQTIAEKVDMVMKTFIKVDEEFFEELMYALISADISADTSQSMIDKLRDKVKSEKISEKQDIKDALSSIIYDTINKDQIKHTDSNVVYLVIGVNGVGKTTTIGKLALKLKEKGNTVMLAAADTFRAAAIDQLKIWANRADVPIIAHAEGQDPASVIYDACVASRAKNIDYLICDTAGRLHNKRNLMEELKKVHRVIERELPNHSIQTLLVLDATTGQNAISQTTLFNQAIPLSGLIITKLDGTSKGGVAISIIDKFDIPIKYIGVGEGIEDLQDFDADAFARSITE